MYAKRSNPSIYKIPYLRQEWPGGEGKKASPYGPLSEAYGLLSQRLEHYNIAWMEDCVPWFYTDQWKRLTQACRIPMCTGEDIYLQDGFMPLLREHAVSTIHPDVLTAGGIFETHRILRAAQEHGIAGAIHMAETPIGCLAAAHVAAAAGTNFVAMEFHSHDIPWWESMVKDTPKPIVQNGWLSISDRPGLDIGELDDEVLRAHMNPQRAGLWESTEEWDHIWTHDRIWS